MAMSKRRAMKEMHTLTLIEELEKHERQLATKPHRADVLEPSIAAIRAELERRWRAPLCHTLAGYPAYSS